jgi:hypothetical protein
MSRKKGSRPRTPKEPELAHAASDDELRMERGTVHTLIGEPRRLLDAIMNGRALLAAAPDFDEDEDGDPDDDFADVADADDPVDFVGFDDEAADPIPEGLDPIAAMVLTTHVLARALLDQVIGANPKRLGTDPIADGDDEPGVDGGILDVLSTNLLPPNATPLVRQSREERAALVDDVSMLLSEVGLEEFDVSCDLEVLRDGTSNLYVTPVSPEHAHVALLDRLFERTEEITMAEGPILALERDASAWEFACWNVAPPPGTSESEISVLASSIREQEYSLVDRVSAALGTSVIRELLDGDGFAELFPRQHHVASALSTSVADVYECVAIDGDRVALRSVRDGRTYTVDEYVDPVPYAVGWLGLGRLLRYDDAGLHLRSPGMIFARPETPDFAREVGDALRRYDEELPAALAVEAVISSVVLGVSVPRRDKPMRSRADARRALDTIREVIEGTEWEDFLTPSTADAPLGGMGVPQYYVPRHRDTTVADFMTALIEQAEGGGGKDGRARAQKPKRSRRWR